MMSVSSFLAEFTNWAASCPDVVAAALVGSHARGDAMPNSDVDLVILCEAPDAMLEGDWPRKFGEVESRSIEDYGVLRSLRVYYRGGIEVEFGLARPSWAKVPLDPGTKVVLDDGARILHDPSHLLHEARRAAVCGYRGERPGAITADGSAVELYLRLPYRGEVDLIAPWISGRNVLELGCGVGRLTKQLLSRGFQVTAVDNSEDMLAHVPSEVIPVCSDIETLDIGARFDAVILASSLINVPASTQRAALLAACSRHLRRGGRFIFERYDPEWLASAREGPLGALGGIELSIDRLRRTPDSVEISLRSKSGSQAWVQHFAATPLDDGQVAECLRAAGLSSPTWIDKRWGYADK